jgi:hypothetical protein
MAFEGRPRDDRPEPGGLVNPASLIYALTSSPRAVLAFMFRRPTT